MDVTAIIPAKVGSLRVKDKNWRPFYRQKCLVDINIEALISAGLLASQIIVSTNSEECAQLINHRYGVGTHIRADKLTHNETNYSDVVRSICDEVTDYSTDIAWSQVCDPLFRDHAKMFDLWSHIKSYGKDSMCAVHPFKMYMLDQNKTPVGWQFGAYHKRSQVLPQYYQFPFTLSILTGPAMQKYGYHVGESPHWFKTEGRHVDIDTEFDFEIAQLMYATIMRNK